VKGLTKSAKFSHLLCHMVNFRQFCTGPQILRRLADSAQNPEIPTQGKHSDRRLHFLLPFCDTQPLVYIVAMSYIITICLQFSFLH